MSSAAVQRRQRGLDRERANIGSYPRVKTIGRYGDRKSSTLLLREDIAGQSTIDETASMTLNALLNARKTGGAIILADPQQQQQQQQDLAIGRRHKGSRGRHGDPSSRRHTAHPQKKKSSAVETYVLELAQYDEAARPLPEWWANKWAKAVAAVRSAENERSRAIGHRPSVDELREDADGLAALEVLESLRDQRDLMLQASRGADDDGGGGGGSGGDGGAHRAGTSGGGGGRDATPGYFRGYARELLRLRQAFLNASRDGDLSDGAAKAQLMLSALAQRAQTEASDLTPPPLPPGVTTLSEEDDSHATYVWKRERAGRMEALAAAVETAASGDGVVRTDPFLAAQEGRRQTEAALAMLVAEEKHERLCEKNYWPQLLDEWRLGTHGGVPRAIDGVSSASAPTLGVESTRAPPKLGLGRGALASSMGMVIASSRFTTARSTARGVGTARSGGGGTSRGGNSTNRGAGESLTARLTFRRRDTPWVDEVARQYGLEFDARQRAAGVAREMAAAGYSGAQARTVVLGMLHGTREKLRAAWHVFVTDDSDDAVLGRVEWRLVLGLITGGLGMTPEEVDQLFKVFDQDGSGALDFTEFCEVLDALPMQRAPNESPIRTAISAAQSVFVLRPQLLARLSIGQLMAAGRIIARLRAANFSDEDASHVVSAIFLSRSRKALSDAWDVLRTASEGGLVAAQAKADGRRGSRRVAISTPPAAASAQTINVEGFKVLLPLLGENLPLAKIERLFEEVDADGSGSLDFDEFVQVRNLPTSPCISLHLPKIPLRLLSRVAFDGFVQMVRKLKPKGTTRNWRKSGVAAFDSLTMMRTGRPRQLRRAVPAARRAEAGALLLVMRDFGYDDDQLMAILQAIFPPPVPKPSAEAPSTVGAMSVLGAAGALGKQRSRDPTLHPTQVWAAETCTDVMRTAWAALGGGEVVRLPANPFDFKSRQAHSADADESPNEALVAYSRRYQCHDGVDSVTLFDLLTLLAEGLGFAGWPPDVTAPLASMSGDASGGGGAPDTQVGFAQVVSLFVQMRRALDDAAAAAEGDGNVESRGFAIAPLQPLLALRSSVALTDEAFANPLRHLVASSAGGAPANAKRAERAGREQLCGGATPDWIDGIDMAALSVEAQNRGEKLRDDLVERVVEPMIDLGENLDPLLPLSRETRAIIPVWQHPVIEHSVGGLRAHGFPSRDVDTIIRALYTVREGGEASGEACRRAWRVLRVHSSRFRTDEQLAIAANPSLRAEQAALLRHKRERRRRRNAGLLTPEEEDEDEEDDDDVDLVSADESMKVDENGRRLPIEQTFRYDHHQLETDAAKRMLWLAAEPLMKKPQLEAIFTALDRDRDGAIDFEELESFLRLLDPFRRLDKLKPIDVPHQASALEQMGAMAAEVAAPGVTALGQLWSNFASASGTVEDDDDDDE